MKLIQSHLQIGLNELTKNIEPKAYLPWHLLQTEFADEGDICIFIATIKLYLDHLVKNNVQKHLKY